eukprot:c21122_g1_i2.p1 GENE.c21122_g1_i2~~c21122_g1_i2.p1  ORF type:complete len:694 (+),score=301.08 c21122_g1_i2:50-2131(+)
MLLSFVLCILVVTVNSFAPPPQQLVPYPAVPSTPEQNAPVSMKSDAMKSWCAQRKNQAISIKNSLLSAQNPSKDDVLKKLNLIDIELGNGAMLASLLSQTHPDEIMRNISTTCELDLKAFSTQLSLDRELYKVVVSVQNDTPVDSVAQRRYERAIRNFKRSGVQFDDKEIRAKIQNLTEEIEALGTQFSQNVNSDTRNVTRLVTDTVSLEGLSKDFIDSHTKDGKVVISTNYPDYQPAIKLAKNSDLRKDLFMAFEQRAFPQNLAILDKVLSKRYELAKLLGYSSWAEYVTEVNMIGNAENANNFILNVTSLTSERTKQEIAELLELKKQDDPASTSIEAYDVSYYSEKLRQKAYSVDNSEVRKYFTYSQARDGVIWVAEQLFAVKFQKVQAQVGWHSSVETYEVYWKRDFNSQTKKRIGRIHLDMFPRDNKYKHAAQFPIRAGVHNIQLPEGALICNFPATGPMEHSQVTTLFHEFGHLMHHIIGGQEKVWAEFSGVATEWDFVEAPSQMLEEWAFDEKILQHFAFDKDSNKIPSDLVKKLKNASLFGKGIYAAQQMFYAALSLQLHMKDPSTFSTSELADQIQLKFSPFPIVPNTSKLSSFGHIIGYSAVYYTYMWSQALGQHIFSVFKKNSDLLEPFTALNYRDEIIRVGGNKDAKVLVYDFVKKPFTLDDLHNWFNEYPVPISSTQATK